MSPFVEDWQMNRTVSIVAVLLAVSCVGSPLTAPAPLNFHSSHSARDAVQVAAVSLVNAGFHVVQSDSIGNALTATRTATHNGNQEYVTCALPKGSGAAANRETVLSLNFRAAPADTGSTVSVSSTVTTTYPGYEGTTMQVAASATDCVSNGTIERQLAAALR
jgi:hypothetical protein